MSRAAKVIWFWPLLLTGCLQWVERPAAESARPRYQVKCGGDCLQLNAAAKNDQAALLAKVEEHLGAQRQASAEVLLERHLDVAIEALRQRDPKLAVASPVDLTLARVVDARLQHPADQGWLAQVQGDRRGGLQRAEDILLQVQELARTQQWKSARDLAQKNQAALAPYPFHAIHAGLTLAEAQRRLGQVELAAKTWQQTAVLAARLAARWPAPSLWEQLAAQRPVPAPWPAAVVANLLPQIPESLHAAAQSPAFVPETLVWFAIGQARLQRADASAALTAFKRAESQAALPDWDDFLALHQAKALLALEQTPAATSLLTTLANRPKGSPWRLPALALLGSGKLHEGQTQQALAFLREGVEASNADFLSRADAEANLGLTLLTIGDEPNGLRWLHSAQQRFESSQDRRALLQCQANEATYLEHAGKTDDASRVRQKMRALELRRSS